MERSKKMPEPKNFLHSLVEELPEESYGQVIDYMLYVKYATEKNKMKHSF
jgi:hypothetical protein